MTLPRDTRAGHRDLTFICEWGIPRDLKTAIRQAEATTEIGGTFAKWQMFNPDRLVSKDAKRYWDPSLGGHESQYRNFSEAGGLTDAEWLRLKAECDRIGVGFLVTPFDLEAVDLLEEIGVEAYKVASGDVNYVPLLKKIAATGKRVFLSTGAATDAEIVQAIMNFDTHGTVNPNVVPLACDLVYPCRADQANLYRIPYLRTVTIRDTGYSDHSRQVVTGAVAVALGATVLEKHVTLTPRGDSPDDKFALTPMEMAEYIRLANEAAVLCAPVEGDPQAAARVGARRSAYAARDISTPRVLVGPDDVVWLRPAPKGSIPPTEILSDWVLRRPIKAGEPIRWKDLG